MTDPLFWVVSIGGVVIWVLILVITVQSARRESRARAELLRRVAALEERSAL